MSPEFYDGISVAFQIVERCRQEYLARVGPAHLASPEGLEALNVYIDCTLAIAALLGSRDLLKERVDALLTKMEAMRG